MSNTTVENVYTRQKAKELTKAYFWKLLGMGALVALVTAGIIIAASLVLALINNSAVMAVGILIASMAAALLGCGMSMGMLAAMIDICRGDATVTVGRVFSRMGQSLKAFGLSLWVSLKIMLWMLPGYVVLFAGMTMNITSAVDAYGNINESAMANIGLFAILGAILMVALVIPAAYRYMLSTYILADKPETGVFDCVKQSKAMMKGHKWQCFKLVIPVMLVMYVVILVASIILGVIVGLIPASAVTGVVYFVGVIALEFVMLYYMIRMYLCYTLFYLKRIEAPAEEAQA